MPRSGCWAGRSDRPPAIAVLAAPNAPIIADFSVPVAAQVVEHVGVGVPALCVGRLLDHRVRLQEPPQLWVVDATVHVDDLCAIHHFMAGEAPRRQRRGGTSTRGIAIRPPIAKAV